MIRKLLLAAALALFAFPALAQNTQCSDRTLGDNTNACANTRFVLAQIAASSIPGFITCPANQFVNVVGAASVCAQPAFSNLSGRATLAQLPQGIANSIWINPTAGTADMQNIAVPPCANDGVHALVYVNASGLQCAALAFPVSLANGGLGGSQAAATAGQVPVYPGSGGAAVPTTISTTGGTVDNLLQNNQWRLWCCIAFSTKQNAAGTANQTNVSCTAFTISTADPVFTCANTQTLRVGDIAIVSNIVSFWGFAGGGFITCVQVQCNGGYVTAARVTNVIANTSVTLHSPALSGISPAASAAATIIPVSPLDCGSSTGPDGWTKTGTLCAFPDDWGAASTPISTVYPGCERPLGLRKGTTGNELLIDDITPALLPLYRGQTVTLGMAIFQRIQGGGSTGNIYIQDSAGTTFSSALTGVSLGGYQFVSVTRTISQTATSVQFGFQPSGNSGDVFDVCLPTAAFVPSMVQSQLHTNTYEKTVAFSHWNPPLLTPDIVNFPTAALGGAAPTLYGYNTNDLEAMTFGEVHNTVGHVWGKLEWKTAASWIGCNIFMGGFVNTGNGALTFGLQAAGQVANIVFPTSMSPVPLYHVGGTFSLYTDCNNAGGVVPTAGTWDFTDIDNNGPTSQQ